MIVKQIAPGIRMRLGIFSPLLPGLPGEIPEHITRDIYTAVTED